MKPAPHNGVLNQHTSHCMYASHSHSTKTTPHAGPSGKKKIIPQGGGYSLGRGFSPLCSMKLPVKRLVVVVRQTFTKISQQTRPKAQKAGGLRIHLDLNGDVSNVRPIPNSFQSRWKSHQKMLWAALLAKYCILAIKKNRKMEFRKKVC